MQVAQPQLTRGRVTLFAFCCGAIVANIYYAQPVINLIAPDVGLSQYAASMIVSLTQVGYGLGLFFLVPLGDLLESRRLILVTTLSAAVSLLAAGVSENASWFLVLSLVVGISSVSVQMLIPLAAHLAEERQRGRVVGNIMSGLLLGILLARPISSLIADHFGWRTVFFAAAGLMMVVALLLAWKTPQRQPDHKAHYGQLLASLVTLFRTLPILRRRAFYQACMFAAFSLFWTAVPLELAIHYGLSQSQIALFALAGAAGAIAAPISGRLADAGYSKPATRYSLLGAIAVLWIAIPSHALGVVGLAITGILLDFCVQMNMVAGQRIIYAIDPASRSRINGIYMASIFAGGATGSALTSMLYSHGGWGTVALAAGIFPLLALLVFLRESSTRPSE